MTRITIITPVFNAESFLPYYFNRLAEQTIDDYEVLVVDDKSTDTTRNIIEKQMEQNARIRLIVLKQRLGAAGARNKGLLHAQGEYVCFLDVDDYWLPKKLAIQLEFMQRNSYSLTYMDYLRVNEQRKVITQVIAPEFTTYNEMLKSNRIGNLSAMFRREAAEGLQFRNIGHEDYVFWLELLKRVGTAYKVSASNPVCCYMVRKQSLSSNKFKAAGWQWVIYREILGLSFVHTVWYMAHYMMLSLSKRF